MVPVIAKRVRSFDLLRGMAFYALDMKGRSREYLDREIERHGNAAADKFLADSANLSDRADVLTWCQDNAERYDLGLATAKDDAPPSHANART
jgi:hypothetical protein